MKKEHVTIKIWKETYRNMRLLSALTGEKIVVLFNRLITEELEKVKEEQR